MLRMPQLAITLLATSCLTIVSAAPNPKQKEQKATAKSAQTVVTNDITSAILQAGVKNCAERINRVSNYQTAGQPFSAFIFMPPLDVDQHQLSLSMEIVPNGEPLTYASSTFSPNAAGGCSSVSESVVYWGAPCDAVAARAFAGAPLQGNLLNNIRTLKLGDLARVYLMPAGAGCISIKKELLP